MIINKAYKFRIYPNEEQKIFINKCIGSSCFVYNYYLNKKEDSCLDELSTEDRANFLYQVNGEKFMYRNVVKRNDMLRYSWGMNKKEFLAMQEKGRDGLFKCYCNYKDDNLDEETKKNIFDIYMFRFSIHSINFANLNLGRNVTHENIDRVFKSDVSFFSNTFNERIRNEIKRCDDVESLKSIVEKFKYQQIKLKELLFSEYECIDGFNISKYENSFEEVEEKINYYWLLARNSDKFTEKNIYGLVEGYELNKEGTYEFIEKKYYIKRDDEEVNITQDKFNELEIQNIGDEEWDNKELIERVKKDFGFYRRNGVVTKVREKYLMQNLLDKGNDVYEVDGEEYKIEGLNLVKSDEELIEEVQKYKVILDELLETYKIMYKIFA